MVTAASAEFDLNVKATDWTVVPILAMCFLAMLGRIWSAGPVSWLHRTTMKYKITLVQSHVGLGAENYRTFSK